MQIRRLAMNREKENANATKEKRNDAFNEPLSQRSAGVRATLKH